MSDNADMKMADKFELPLKWDDDLDPKEVKVFKCGGDAAEYAVHAINTHDTLTAENKALREALKGMLVAIDNVGGEHVTGFTQLMEAYEYVEATFDLGAEK